MAEERIEYALERNGRRRHADVEPGRHVENIDHWTDGGIDRAAAFERAEWINRLAPATEAVVVKRTVTYGDWTKA